MASPTRWTWVWVNSGSWWWTGRPGVLRFMGSQSVGHDWATELNWKALFLSGSHLNVLTDACLSLPVFAESLLCFILVYDRYVRYFCFLTVITLCLYWRSNSKEFSLFLYNSFYTSYEQSFIAFLLVILVLLLIAYPWKCWKLKNEKILAFLGGVGNYIHKNMISAKLYWKSSLLSGNSVFSLQQGEGFRLFDKRKKKSKFQAICFTGSNVI